MNYGMNFAMTRCRVLLLLLSADAEETTSGTETAIAKPAVAATMRSIFFMGSFFLFAF